jgi:hypothetical protein
LFRLDLLTGHEPRDWSAGLRPGSILRPDTNAPDRRPALRFMEWETRSPLGKKTCGGMGESRFRVPRRPQNTFLLPEGEGQDEGKGGI